MLPPFVPPSVRSANEYLPPITDFAIGGAERSFGSQTDPNHQVDRAEVQVPEQSTTLLAGQQTSQLSSTEQPPASPAAAQSPALTIEYSLTLPSIEEFVARAPYVERQDAITPVVDTEPEFVQLRHASPQIENEESDSFAVSTANESIIVSNRNQIDSVVPATPVGESVTAAQTIDEKADTSTPQRGWIEEERDAFDWQSVATLATPANDEERATKEWMSTDWDTPSTSQTENVAGILMQLARRVRSGELKIEAIRGMSTEAALAAVLTALLSEPDAEMGAQDHE